VSIMKNGRLVKQVLCTKCIKSLGKASA